jgi:hypothetical protein
MGRLSSRLQKQQTQLVSELEPQVLKPEQQLQQALVEVELVEEPLKIKEILYQSLRGFSGLLLNLAFWSGNFRFAPFRLSNVLKLDAMKRDYFIETRDKLILQSFYAQPTLLKVLLELGDLHICNLIGREVGHL